MPRWDLVYKWADPESRSLVDAVTSALENCDRKLKEAEARATAGAVEGADPDGPIRIAGDGGPDTDDWRCRCGLWRPVTGSYGCADCGDGRPDSWERRTTTPEAPAAATGAGLDRLRAFVQMIADEPCHATEFYADSLPAESLHDGVSRCLDPEFNEMRDEETGEPLSPSDLGMCNPCAARSVLAARSAAGEAPEASDG